MYASRQGAWRCARAHDRSARRPAPAGRRVARRGRGPCSVDRRRAWPRGRASRSPRSRVVSTMYPRRCRIAISATSSSASPGRPGASRSAQRAPVTGARHERRDRHGRRRRAATRAPSCAVSQQRAAHLAARGLRQLVGELDDPRVLVRRRLGLDVVLQLARRARRRARGRRAARRPRARPSRARRRARRRPRPRRPRGGRRARTRPRTGRSGSRREMITSSVRPSK